MISDWEEKEKSIFEEGNKMLSDKILQRSLAKSTQKAQFFDRLNYPCLFSISTVGDCDKQSKAYVLYTFNRAKFLDYTIIHPSCGSSIFLRCSVTKLKELLRM